jgi:Tfp pilus assembly protein PilZ
MRILPAYFARSEEFLAAYQPERPEFDGPALVVRTRTDLRQGEHVLLEVAMPRLPNREHLRAEVAGPGPDGVGVWVVIAPADWAALGFIVASARKLTKRVITRHHERYPVTLPCDWQVAGETTRILSTTEDLGAGGVFVRAYAPPEIGTEVVVALPSTRSGSLTLRGQVAWIRKDEEGGAGMGVRFLSTSEADGKRLRELLRRAGENGRVDLQ